MTPPLASRREFIQTGIVLGGGMALLCCARPISVRAPVCEGRTEGLSPNAFVCVGEDESVTVVVGRSEMGQGVFTSLAMLVAEELDADWRRVRVRAAPVHPEYDHPTFRTQMTAGSTSVRSSFEPLRRAGAQARAMLLAAAARRWGVPIESCRSLAGTVFHEPTARRLTYGQLVRSAAAQPPPRTVRLKQPSEYRILGKPAPRLDAPEKITGRAKFGLDVDLPGLRTALIIRAPSFGARVLEFDATAALQVPGVTKVARISSGVAVIGSSFWAAQRGRAKVTVRWDHEPGNELSSSSVLESFARLAQHPGTEARRDGMPERALSGASKRVEAVYTLPYLAHAAMEPLNCVVALRGDGCDVWTGTQFQTGDRNAAARVAGVPRDRVRLHTTFLGGGFGRRASPSSDFVTEAVEVAKVAQAPVKVVWTREDDMRGGYYRPASYNWLNAGLDEEGRPLAWTHRIVGQSILEGTLFERHLVKGGFDPTSVEGAASLPYSIPHVLVDLHSPRLNVPVLWWRSVGHSIHGFVTESFLDELAVAARADPLEYRLALLAERPRHRAVLELVAERSGWGTPLPEGMARGLAVHESFGSCVAQVAEVSLDAKRQIRVHRVVCAIDCGFAVNPLGIEAQMESGIAFGLGAALHGAITIRAGRVDQSNFHDYRLLRMDEMPRVEVHLVPSSAAPGGVGEPGTPPVAPAVANALYALTGVRLRALPFSLPATR